MSILQLGKERSSYRNVAVNQLGKKRFPDKLYQTWSTVFCSHGKLENLMLPQRLQLLAAASSITQGAFELQVLSLIRFIKKYLQ